MRPQQLHNPLSTLWLYLDAADISFRELLAAPAPSASLHDLRLSLKC